jgi:hypothetical protein
LKKPKIFLSITPPVEKHHTIVLPRPPRLRLPP